ncbi:MAG: hypothetical protein K2I95_02370, partial [Treponemataceae bacterium]|nr:hypothetical protein [Treponemataceae bacterium]
MTIFEAKKFIVKKIEKISQTPFLDAEIFLQEILGKDKTFILMNKNLACEEAQDKTSAAGPRAREQGVAVAY